MQRRAAGRGQGSGADRRRTPRHRQLRALGARDGGCGAIARAGHSQHRDVGTGRRACQQQRRSVRRPACGAGVTGRARSGAGCGTCRPRTRRVAALPRPHGRRLAQRAGRRCRPVRKPARSHAVGRTLCRARCARRLLGPRRAACARQGREHRRPLRRCAGRRRHRRRSARAVAAGRSAAAAQHRVGRRPDGRVPTHRARHTGAALRSPADRPVRLRAAEGHHAAAAPCARASASASARGLAREVRRRDRAADPHQRARERRPRGRAAAAPATPPPVYVAPPATPAAAPSPRTASDDELLAAFLRGLASTHQPPEMLTPGLMERIGAMLRTSTEGTLQLLLTRQEFKREVRAEVTMIASQANNPLKFSPTVEVALAHLLGPGVRGFMPPEAAMRDAFDDLRAHQFGVMVGMRAALAHVIGRFEPAELEKKISAKTALDALFAANRKAKLWDQFVALYGGIASEAEDDFHSLFGKAFLAAYEEQMARLKSDT
ncbi:type VI secretion system-associated FHA domain protein TagH [Variovorax paradoxus]|uniref:type VI secretion system-associated FHA domain protein TagH n=1 Tax=Variovorax paradoxus TaxID=34073 RepID=UPI001D172705|nr:type VI secretion system-associated FHA domain protein TagH [Variovorax paradoxus]